MKRFIKDTAIFLGIPLIVLIIVYLISDPFCSLRPFSMDYFDESNRDNLSTNLFIENYPQEQYDSFIFGSCRSARINTYHWLKYLPEGSSQFMFQAWGETITGIEQKIEYLDNQGVAIKNALVLIDIPGSFSPKQTSYDAILLKSYKYTGMPQITYQAILFYDYIQKPSMWFKGFSKHQPDITFDPISNDWHASNATMDITVCPVQDSLKMTPKHIRDNFFRKVNYFYPEDPEEKPQLISDAFENQLKHIQDIFERQGTKAAVVVSPSYYYTSNPINTKDLDALRCIFGKENVYDFSHKNSINTDYNNYYDPDHFGLCAGWMMIEEIYQQ